MKFSDFWKFKPKLDGRIVALPFIMILPIAGLATIHQLLNPLFLIAVGLLFLWASRRKDA